MSLTESQLLEIIRQEVARSTPAPAAAQENHVHHVLNCPECYGDLVKGMEKMKEGSEYFCSNCDLPPGSKEFAEKFDDCPRCHQKDAYKK